MSSQQSAHTRSVAKAVALASLVLLSLFYPAAARAVTLRYALIIGNNHGSDGSIEMPPLLHAEREARLLREQLVELSNFDPSPDRTVLLLGATKSELDRALDTLVAVREKDLASIGQGEVLFGFFFTGHGLRGRLLLDDGPLGSEELGRVFKRMRADFTVGLFDACYSGSLDEAVLRDKGIEATPGVNIFRELPEEVLAANGSVFYVSSGPDQPSYEDERLGGVFTHFFVEALSRAEREGPGIPLERIWDYARERTVDFTAARQRRQTPQQYVRNLRARGPVYFSFPQERSATLTLGPSVAGKLVLSYTAGQLTEVIEKSAGVARELAVYPGRARLMLVAKGEVRAQDEIELKSGATVFINDSPAIDATRPRLGHVAQSLWEKGLVDARLLAYEVRPGTSILAGAGYGLALTEGGVLSPLHAPAAMLRLDHGPLTMSARVGYGQRRESFVSWGYRADAVTAELGAGYGFDAGPVRLSATVLAGGARVWQTFDDGAGRSTWLLQPGIGIAGIYPAGGRIAAELGLRGGLEWAAGAGVQDPSVWVPWMGATAAILVRLD